MRQHVIVVGWLNIVFSIIWLLMGLAAAVLLLNIGCWVHDREVLEIMSILSPLIVVFCFITALPGIIGGIFLLKFKEWARILVLILSFIDLINFPIGTAIGIYAIWVLLHRDTVKLFIAQPESPAQPAS
jgi:hypothetical protein